MTAAAATAGAKGRDSALSWRRKGCGLMLERKAEERDEEEGTAASVRPRG
jgi:hypothetical protein